VNYSTIAVALRRSVNVSDETWAGWLEDAAKVGIKACAK
jgi:hypothetical protein